MEFVDKQLKTLNEEMRCGIFTNSSGKIVIIHDQKIKKNLGWIEYDDSLKQAYLVYKDGSIQNLGILIPDNMLTSLSKGKLLSLLHLVNGNVQTFQETTFIWRES